MTNRERENDRVSSIGRGNLPQGNLAKVNINFTNDSQMTSSGTKLVGLPSKEDSKQKNGALAGGQIKKTLQSTNSTSLLDTMANSNNSSALNSSLNKGNQFLPNFRQKQHKDLQNLHHNTSVSPPKQKQGSFGPQQKL